VTSLGSAVRRALRRARLPYDPKPFRPHLTLARPGDRVDVRADVAELTGYRGPEWPVEEIHLVRSHLGPKPTYDRLATIPL
jgi:2'-5' RNA ligase